MIFPTQSKSFISFLKTEDSRVTCPKFIPSQLKSPANTAPLFDQVAVDNEAR